MADSQSVDHGQDGRVLRPLLTYTLLGLAQRGIWVLMLPVYLALLPPAQFGVLVLVTFAATVIAVPANLKLDAAMRTFYFDYGDDTDGRMNYLRQVLGVSAASALLYYGVWLLLGAAVFDVVFAHDDLQYFPLGAIALATGCINTVLTPYIAFLRNATMLRELVWLQAALLVGNVGLQCLLIVVFGLGVRGALLGALLPSFVAMCYVLLIRPGAAQFRWRSAALLPSLRYSAPLMVFAFFFLLETRLDTIVLEHFLDLSALGAYAVLISLLGLLAFALNALDNAIRPLLFPALKENGSATADAIARFKNLYVVTGLVVLAVAVLLGSLLGLLTDDPAYLGIRQWLPAGATAFVPMILTRFYSLFYDFHKRSVELTAWIAVRTGLMFVLLLLLVPAHGIGGALLAVFLSQFVNAGVFAVSARRKFAVTAPLWPALLQVGLFLLIIWALYPWLGHGS